MVWDRSCFVAPMPLVVLDCGSISTSNTLRPAAARYVDRLIAVVVFPTPPFCFVIAFTFDTGCYLSSDHTFKLLNLMLLYGHCNKCIDDNQLQLTRSPITPYNQNSIVC